MQTADRRVTISQPELLGAVFAQLRPWEKDRHAIVVWRP